MAKQITRKAITIHDGVRERFIGTLDAEAKVFSKKVAESKHLFIKLDAWGIDAQYFTDVLLPNGYSIKVHDTERGVLYWADAATVQKFGQFYHFRGKEDNRAQIFLPRCHWNRKDVPAGNDQLLLRAIC